MVPFPSSCISIEDMLSQACVVLQLGFLILALLQQPENRVFLQPNSCLYAGWSGTVVMWEELTLLGWSGPCAIA